MNGYYAQVIEQLKKDGFKFVRPGKGSHEIWGNGNLNVSVSRNCKSRYTANAILDDAGSAKRF